MSTVTIKNSTFSDNDMTSVDLGVISTCTSSMTIQNSIFMNNHLNPSSTLSRLTSDVGAVIDAVGDGH